VDSRNVQVRWRAAALLGALVVLSAALDIRDALHRGLAPTFDSLRLPVAWLAGLALAMIAARLVRESPRAGAMAARLLVIGASLSAVPSLVGLARAAAAARDPIAAAWHAFLTVRSAPLFADLNAGGSYFAMFAVAAVWLAATARRPSRWAVPAALLLLALWLTGSRTALASAVIVLPMTWVAVRRPSGRAIGLVGLSAAVVLASVVLAPPAHEPQASAGYATRVRVDMAKVALAMSAAHPVFGVGLGHFQRESVRFIPPGVVAYFPPAAAGENAHNNFLQMLAELGVPGLAAFLGLIWAPLRANWRTMRRGRASHESIALAAGVTAFLVTCLAGHPLLSAYSTIAFVLALGIVLGLAAGTSSVTRDVPVTGSRDRPLRVQPGNATAVSSPTRAARPNPIP
jgi:O-antigen ligase